MLWVIDRVLTRLHFSITQMLTVKFSHAAHRAVSLGDDGRLFPDNKPDDSPYKTLDTSGAMVITVIKALLYHRVHPMCTERPLRLLSTGASKMNIIIIIFIT